MPAACAPCAALIAVTCGSSGRTAPAGVGTSGSGKSPKSSTSGVTVSGATVSGNGWTSSVGSRLLPDPPDPLAATDGSLRAGAVVVVVVVELLVVVVLEVVVVLDVDVVLTAAATTPADASS